MGTGALYEIKDLVSKVNFSDKSNEVAALLCEIIVAGKPDYEFVPDPEVPFYYGQKDTIWLDELMKSLLERSGLIEVEEGKITIIKPTGRGLKIYEMLKEEGKLTEDGLLERASENKIS